MKYSMSSLIKNYGKSSDLFSISRFSREEVTVSDSLKRPDELSISTRLLGRLVETIVQLELMISVDGLSIEAAKKKTVERYMRGAKALSGVKGSRAFLVTSMVGGQPLDVATELVDGFTFSYTEDVGVFMSNTSLNCLAKLMWMSKFASSLEEAMSRDTTPLHNVNVDDATCEYISGLVRRVINTFKLYGTPTHRRYRKSYTDEGAFDAYGFFALTTDSMWFLLCTNSYPDSRFAIECIANYLLSLKNGVIGDGTHIKYIRIYNPVINLVRSCATDTIDLTSVREILEGLLNCPRAEVNNFVDTVDFPTVYEYTPVEVPEGVEDKTARKRRRRRKKKLDNMDDMTPTERRIEVFQEDKPSLSEFLTKCVLLPRGGIVPESAVHIKNHTFSHGLRLPDDASYTIRPGVAVDVTQKLAFLRTQDVAPEQVFDAALTGAKALDDRKISKTITGIDVGQHVNYANQLIQTLCGSPDAPLTNERLRDILRLRWFGAFTSEKSFENIWEFEFDEQSAEALRELDVLSRRTVEMLASLGKVHAVKQPLVIDDTGLNIKSAQSDCVFDDSISNISMAKSKPSSKQLLATGIRLVLAQDTVSASIKKASILNPRLGVSWSLTQRSVAEGTNLRAQIERLIREEISE